MSRLTEKFLMITRKQLVGLPELRPISFKGAKKLNPYGKSHHNQFSGRNLDGRTDFRFV
jgi:hypothetical protein